MVKSLYEWPISQVKRQETYQMIIIESMIIF